MMGYSEPKPKTNEEIAQTAAIKATNIKKLRDIENKLNSVALKRKSINEIYNPKSNLITHRMGSGGFERDVALIEKQEKLSYANNGVAIELTKKWDEIVREMDYRDKLRDYEVSKSTKQNLCLSRSQTLGRFGGYKYSSLVRKYNN